MRAAVVVFVVCACSKPAPVVVASDPSPSVAPPSSPSPSPSPSQSSVPSATVIAPAPPAKKPTPDVRCTASKDCTVSCALGAVSAAWWDAWDKDGECKDGCSRRSEARCQKGRCVALQKDGTVDTHCTISP